MSSLLLTLAITAATVASRSFEVNFPPNVLEYSRNSTVRSFAGYSPFGGASTGCSMFYWYFPGANPSSPVFVWYSGGPGLSSLQSALFGASPVTLTADTGKLSVTEPERRPFGSQSVMFVDIPAGTGLSFCDESKIPLTSSDVAESVLPALNDAFQSLGIAASTKVVLAGQNYAGHVLPPLGAAMLDCPMWSKRLAGMIVGNGHTHPPIQVVTKPESALYFGMLDVSKQCIGRARSVAEVAARSSTDGDYATSIAARNTLEEVVGQCSSHAVSFQDVRTNDSVFNRRTSALEAFMNGPGKAAFQFSGEYKYSSSAVRSVMANDIMSSVISDVERLLKSGVPCSFFQGQFDWVDGVLSNEAWIKEVKWSGQKSYGISERTPVQSGDDSSGVCGFSKNHGLLSETVVLHAGHSAIIDDPQCVRTAVIEPMAARTDGARLDAVMIQ